MVPKEGATGWADTTMMHSDAPNPNCAYLWMEHSLDPKVQGDLAAWFGSVPSVPDACEGNELLAREGCVTNGFDNFDQIEFWRTPQSDCFAPDSGEVCVPYQAVGHELRCGDRRALISPSSNEASRWGPNGPHLSPLSGATTWR